MLGRGSICSTVPRPLEFCFFLVELDRGKLLLYYNILIIDFYKF